MEEVVRDENLAAALGAVTHNQGAPGIDDMKTTEVESHFQAHWPKIRMKLLRGPWVPSPVRRVAIPKPNGGRRMLGIPTVVDRVIQQMLLQAPTPIFEPLFSPHSYGFRPGRSAHDAVRAAQQYAQGGKDWVVDIDISSRRAVASVSSDADEPPYLKLLDEMRNWALPAGDPVFSGETVTDTGEVLPRRYVLGLGSRDFHFSGTYQSDGYTIGYLRVPHFSPSASQAMRELEAEISYFQANTDGLMVDVMRYPGGGKV